MSRYYAGRLDAHGPTPRGVDWNGEPSQQLRFTQLLRLFENEPCPTIADYGCGYGALAQRLLAEGREFSYVGFDAAESMIAAARSLIDDSRCRFTVHEDEIGVADFVLASGVFNVKLDVADAAWEQYVGATLERIAAHSVRGFAFNMLTRYADPPLIREHLYYADPARYFALCKQKYAHNVALLHDYDLYEFTVVVRLGQAPTPLAGA